MVAHRTSDDSIVYTSTSWSVSRLVLPERVSSAQEPGALALIYDWKAKPGQLDSYNRYIREIAEPIDEEALRRGAFLSVTTFVSQKTDGPWTHMRVFVLRDKVQLDALSAALDAAGGGTGRAPRNSEEREVAEDGERGTS